MEKYILSLIKENNRVIVPNFGAFIIAKENGFSVLFNNFLSFNDGLLVDYVAGQENITKEEAGEKVENYVNALKEKLDTDGEYVISGLGRFTKDNTGIIRFEQKEGAMDDVPDLSESDDLLDFDNEVEDSVEPRPVAPSDTQNAVESVQEEKKLDVPEENVEDKPKASVMEEEKVERSIKTDSRTESNRYIEEDNTKRNRSIMLFLVLFVLVPVIGLSYYYLFYKGDDKVVEPPVVEEPVKQPEVTPVTEQEDVIDAGPEIVEEQEEVKPVQQPVLNKKKPHHIIVGSFSTEANAGKMVDKLHQKGFEAAQILQHNGRILVSLEAFAKVYEARNKQEAILNKDRMESWVLTKR